MHPQPRGSTISRDPPMVLRESVPFKGKSIEIISNELINEDRIDWTKPTRIHPFITNTNQKSLPKQITL